MAIQQTWHCLRGKSEEMMLQEFDGIVSRVNLIVISCCLNVHIELPLLSKDLKESPRASSSEMKDY